MRFIFLHRMKKAHYLAIGIAVIIVALLYLFADVYQLKPSQTGKTGGMPTAQTDNNNAAVSTFDMTAFLDKVNKNFSTDSIQLIKKLASSSSQQDLQSLVAIYHAKGESIAEAYYTQKLAAATNNAATYLRAASLFEITAQMTENQELGRFLADNAVASYAAANNISPSDSTTLRLAVAYMNQGANPMQGVTLLRELVTKDSTNAEAQFMLGKFGVVSKQYDKAIIRFEKVLYLQPKNTEALFLAGMAYRETGNNAKAKEYLQKCIKLVTNPALKAEIEGYLKEIK